MKFKIALILILTLGVGANLSGQDNKKKFTIEGIVTNANRKPIVGAIIMIDNNMTSSTTDEEGYYKIKVKATAEKIGIFTGKGGVIEEPIKGRTTINFTVGISNQKQSETQQNPNTEENINVGYGTVNKQDISGQVNKIDGKKSKYASYTNIYQMISGEVPGVRVNGNSITIQGASSFNSSTEPLFVVDGVPRESIDDIPPQMVKSIEVLKGSSAAIYGTRGANGVILIDLDNAKDNK